jgi:hypothetical protein
MFNYPVGSGGKPSTKKPMAKSPQEQMGGMDSGAPEGEEAPEAVAAEHGPAVEVHHQHDHEMGVHQVHSVHSDGHEHHSQHGSADEALEHHKKLVGGGEPSEEHNEEEGEEPWGEK